MKNFKKAGVILVTMAVALGVLAGAVAYAADEPKQVVKYRKAVMKAQLRHFLAIKSIVRGKVSFTG